MIKTNRVTITDIARSIGMSHATVSMALKGDVRIAEGTRRKVGDAAKELGYRPSRLAQGLKSGKTMLIGVVSDRSALMLGERWEGYWLAGMHDAAREAGYRLLLNLPIEGEDRFWQTRPISAKGIDDLADGMVDGVIVIGGNALSKKDLGVLEKAGLPVVFAANDEPVPGYSQLLSGHADRFYRLTLALIARGHMSLGVAGMAGAPLFNKVAREQVARAFKEKGLRFNDECYKELSSDHRPGMMAAWEEAARAWTGKLAVSCLLFSYADQAQFLEELCDQKGIARTALPEMATLGPIASPHRRWWGKGLLWDADRVQAGRDTVGLLLDRLKGGKIETKMLQWQPRSLESYWEPGKKT